MIFDHYVYHGTDILKNKFNIMDQEKLMDVERVMTMRALYDLHVKGITGRFDMQHLKSIHEQIFKDVYDWAGEFRDVEIYKNGTAFVVSSYINEELDILFDKIKRANYYRGLGQDETAVRLADVMIELNKIHPFRDGNGRTQRIFVSQLALNAGYDLDFKNISEDDMREAGIAAETGRPNLMHYLFKSNMTCLYQQGPVDNNSKDRLGLGIYKKVAQVLRQREGKNKHAHIDVGG